MKMSKDKALIINLFTMVALIITAICDFIFFNGDKLFRVVLMAVTLWLMYFVYKRTFLKKSRVSFYLLFIFIVGSMYLGSIFLISSAAILALKELSESTDNKERYLMLRKLGTDDKMINRALFKQIGIYFMFPLIIAIIHSVVGLKFATTILATFGKVGLLGSIILTAVVLVLIYGGYFLITYFCSRNIIKER